MAAASLPEGVLSSDEKSCSPVASSSGGCGATASKSDSDSDDDIVFISETRKPISILYGPRSTSELDLIRRCCTDKYKGKPVQQRSTRSSTKFNDTDYLGKAWFGKTADRAEIVETLSNCGWAGADSDLSCLLSDTAWLNDEVMNSIMCVVAKHSSTKIGVFSSFFYTKLSNIFEESGDKSPGLKSGLDLMCRWVHPKKSKLQGSSVVLINHHMCHWSFVHVETKPVDESGVWRTGTRPRLSYYDSYKGRNNICLDRLEKFFQHFGEIRGCPELTGSWHKRHVNPPQVPAQTDSWNCGLFVLAAVDCLAANSIPNGYGSSSMPAFRKELAMLFSEAGLGKNI
jgi:Ulp1 family protease